MPDEARDWETLRSDAIRAAREVTGDDELAETVTDAILEVFDEEAVNRLADEHIKHTNLRSMDFRNGAKMKIEPAREMAAHWVGAARALLEGAENYSETTMTFGIPEDRPQRYSFVVQKVGKLTPHEARRKAEAERDEARAEVERLKKLVAALESNGDRIGYAVVTYNQASGMPEFEYSDLHTELEDAVNERDYKREETARSGRGETHVVAGVVELSEDDDA